MPKTAEPRETISTYLPPADAELLRDRAAAADRSLAAEIRQAVRFYLLNDARPASDRARVTTRPGTAEHAAG